METRLSSADRDSVQRCFRRKHVFEHFYNLAETLLWRNEAVSPLLDMSKGPRVGPNESQRVFATVAILDLEVPNGGLTQFFWNRPGWVDHVPASLRSIGLASLADAFEASTAELIAQVGAFAEFRKRDSLEAYSECASQFDFDEFDDTYLDQQNEVYTNTIAYVMQRLSDFVVDRDVTESA